jgi:hypothetical protein
VRLRQWLTGAVCAIWLPGTVLIGAGCGAGGDSAARLVTPSPTRQPAAEAGGACQLLDYDVIQAQLGVRFDIAASGNVDATYTCILQPAKSDLPDLSLAVTATQADASVFKTSVEPKGGATVSDLGKVAYSAPVAAGGGAGPGIEVGWLSGNQRLIILRYRGPDGAAAGDANALLPKMVALAKAIDLTSV